MEKEYETQPARKYVRMTFHCRHCLLCETKEVWVAWRKKTGSIESHKAWSSQGSTIKYKEGAFEGRSRLLLVGVILNESFSTNKAVVFLWKKIGKKRRSYDGRSLVKIKCLLGIFMSGYVGILLRRVALTCLSFRNSAVNAVLLLTILLLLFGHP